MAYVFQRQTKIEVQPPSRSQAWDQDLAELVQRTGQGDQAAFTMLYNATHTFVYGLALRIVRDQAAAEDVTTRGTAR